MTRRVRIGVFVNDLLSPYQIRLFNSIKRAADAKGMGVIGFQGNFLVRPDAKQRAAFDGSFIYGLAGEESVDGLVVISNVLSSRVGVEAAKRLCQSSKLPVVSVGKLPGVPSIETASDEALSELVEHLVQDHGRKKFVLIEGPSGNPDNIARGRVVRDTLVRMNVPLRDTHVVQGDFLETSGAAAVRILLDQRGLYASEIDAVVALNDQMAAGALYELGLRGIRVPQDISIIGFDDDDFARSANPPITTVSQPIELIGERSIQLVTALMRREPVADLTVLDAEPVWRRSCGCDVPQTSRYVSVIPEDITARSVQAKKAVCYERYNNWAGLLADARAIETAVAAVEAESSIEVTRFLKELEDDIFRAYKNGMDPLRWHDVLSPLSELIERGIPMDAELARRRDRRMRAVSLLINEVAARVRALDQLHTMQWAHAARVLGSALLSVRHLQYLDSILNAGLPSLGIRYCCVCLFVDDLEPRDARVAALYSPDLPPMVMSPLSPEELWLAAPGSIPPEHNTSSPRTTVFPATELVHPRLNNSVADSLDLSVYPLVYAHATLGYVVFDAPADAHQSWLLEGLAGSLSSAVYATKRNAELRKARDRAEKANAAKSEFVAMITHEVRTPLTAVIGHLDLCLQTDLSSSQARHVQQALTSSNTLLGIVNDILDFSKIEAQRIELEHAPFSLDDVLDQVIAACAQSAARKGVRLLVDAEPDIPHWVKGDPLRLGQVLLNLVSNAVKFSTEGDVRLNVVRVPGEAPGGLQLKFTVEDEGIGMHQEIIDRIFEPFTQGDGSMTRKYGGTGLGLTISRRLVRLMNGEISVASEPGEGSCFEFTAEFKLCEYPIEDLIHGAGRRILLATANGEEQKSIEHLLTRYGFRVTTVSMDEGWRDAMRAANDTDVPFSMVIWDDTLDTFGDYSLLESGRALLEGAGTAVMVILPAGRALPSDLSDGIPNLSAVIHRPYQRRNLVQVLAHALSAPRSFPPKPLERDVGVRLPEGTTVLIVQDEAGTCEVLEEMLKRAGAKSCVATTGKDAVDQVRRQLFDAVLLDLHLPDMTGYAVAEAVRGMKNGEKVPIIAVSASTLRSSFSKCLASGIDDFLEAPVEARVLIGTVRHWLRCDESSSRATISVLPPAPASAGSDAVSICDTGDLDAKRAIARLEGNRTLYMKLLARFVQSGADETARLRDALDRDDRGAAGLIAHTLCSTAVNIGAVSLHEAARALESALKGGASSGSIEGCFVDLDTAFGRTLLAAERRLRMEENEVGGAASAPQEPDWYAAAEQLRAHIDAHDSAAIDQLRVLHDALSPGIASGKAFERLSAELSSYDFEQARGHLDALVEAARKGESSPADS